MAAPQDEGKEKPLEFCKYWLQVLRLLKLYDPENVNFAEPLANLQKVLNDITDRMGTARLQSEEGVLYFNKDPVRGGRRAFGTIQGTVQAMDQIGIVEVAFNGAWSVPQLRQFFGFLRVPEGVKELDIEQAKANIATAGLACSIYKPGEGTGVAEIQQVDIDPKTYFPLAYARTLVLLREYVKNMRSEELNRYFTQKLHRALQELVRLVKDYDYKFLQMAAVRDMDEYLFSHMANTGFLAVALGHRLGVKRVDLSNLALAGMLHALGKFRTDKRLWERTKMPKKALIEMGRHPYRSLAAILEGRKLTRKTLVSMAVAYQWDLHRGYTRTRKQHSMHPFSMIVRVCEMYDALTSTHPDQPALMPDQAIKQMVQAPKGWFDDMVLTVFTNMMGLFPTGTTVSLSTGEVAVVVHPNPQKPKRPLVAIVLDRQGNSVDGDFLDLAEKIGGSYPCEITGSVDPNELGISVPDYLLA